MSPEQERVDAAFIKIAAKEKVSGIESLTPSEKVILRVYHSLGLIENRGIEGYLFVISDIFPIDQVIGDLIDLQLEEVAAAINQGAQTLLGYLLQNQDVDPPDFDNFRRMHGAELRCLSAEVYSREPQIIRALLALVTAE